METEDPSGIVQQRIEDFRPEAIGVSVRNIDDQKMTPSRFLLEQTKEIVNLCREHSEAPIILGGAGYSIFPQSALEYLGAHMGIQGEGEVLFPHLLNRLQRREDLRGFPGLYLPQRGLQGPRTFIPRLDELPWTDIFSWFRFKQKIEDYWVTVQTRRGCPMGCSYCSTETIEGRTIRKRDPRTVAEDLAVQMERGVGQFYFTDNTFNLPVDYAEELCRNLKNFLGKARWRGIIYPGKISPALAKVMAESGCLEVSIGFESGSPEMLRSLKKRFELSEVRRTFEILGDQGIRRMGFLLLGGPGETKETVLESLAFADSLPLEALKVTAGIRIYPETPLAETALGEGVIDRETNLLFPTYYLAKGLEDWLNQTVTQWLSSRPHWMM
jgi:radical SAM superfamily enzyme YgiQ (UPF0313 family)